MHGTVSYYYVIFHMHVTVYVGVCMWVCIPIVTATKCTCKYVNEEHVATGDMRVK